MENKRVQLTANPLRSLAATDPCRYDNKKIGGSTWN